MIKQIAALFFIFTANALAAGTIVNENFVNQDNNGVSFAKYVFNGAPVWSDQERDMMISTYNVISSNTIPITQLNFVLIYPTQVQITCIETILGQPISGGPYWQDVNGVKKKDAYLAWRSCAVLP